LLENNSNLVAGEYVGLLSVLRKKRWGARHRVFSNNASRSVKTHKIYGHDQLWFEDQTGICPACVRTTKKSVHARDRLGYVSEDHACFFLEFIAATPEAATAS
jgi:hypothetical protein